MAIYLEHDQSVLFDVVVGTPVIAQRSSFYSNKPLPHPLTVQCSPGAGGTLLMEYRMHDQDSWVEVATAFATDTVYLLSGPVQALRFTAAVNDGTASIST